MQFEADGKTNHIGGKWLADAAGAVRTATSPIDGSAIGTIAWSGREMARQAIAAARAAQPAWGRTSLWDRASHLRRAAVAIRAQLEPLAALLTLEQG
jgi:acyl-CoA reductase-like NAD-dependent aldehyde dehydrogenase